MKKKRFIAGLAVSSMLLMGVGYAAWTDGLQVNTKATSGELKVDLIDACLYGQYEGLDSEKGWTVIDGIGEQGYLGPYNFQRTRTAPIDGDNTGVEEGMEEYAERQFGKNAISFDVIKGQEDGKLGEDNQFKGAYTAGTTLYKNFEIDITNMYPGYAQVFRSDIVNMGSLAAKLSKIDASLTGNQDENMKDLIGINLYVQREYHGTEKHVDVFRSLDLQDADTFEIGGVTFVRLSALEVAMTKAKFENNTLFITPEANRMDLYLGVAMDLDADGQYTTGRSSSITDQEDTLSENTGVTLTLDFLWDQFNVDANAPFESNSDGSSTGEVPYVTNAPDNVLSEQDRSN